MEELSNNTPIFLLNREIGARRPINRGKLIIHNISKGKTEPISITIPPSFGNIKNFYFEGNFVVFGTSRFIFGGRVKRPAWRVNFTDNEVLGEEKFDIFKIVGRCLVVTSQDLSNPSIDRSILRIIDMETGKEIQSFQKENLINDIALVKNRIFEDVGDKIIERDLDGDIAAVWKKEKLRGNASHSLMKMSFTDSPEQYKTLLGADKYFVKIEKSGFFFKNLQTHEAGYIDLKLEDLGSDGIEYLSSHVCEGFLFIGMHVRVPDTEDWQNYIYAYDLENKIRKWIPCEKSEDQIHTIRFNGDKLCFNIGNTVTIVDSLSSNFQKLESVFIKDLSSDGKILILKSTNGNISSNGYILYDLVEMRLIKELYIPHGVDSKPRLQGENFFVNHLNTFKKYNYNDIELDKEIELDEEKPT